MNSTSASSFLSIEDVLIEAIRHEGALVDYYRRVITTVGPDAEAQLNTLREDHQHHIVLLKTMLEEIQSLRELTVAMAD